MPNLLAHTVLEVPLHLGGLHVVVGVVELHPALDAFLQCVLCLLLYLALTPARLLASTCTPTTPATFANVCRAPARLQPLRELHV